MRLSRLKSSRRRQQRHRGRYRNPDESVERQLRLIRAYAAEHGLVLPEELIYRDNGRSAWKPGKGNRGPTGTGMLADGKAGRFGGLLVWKLDRFARNVRDGEDLIDLGVLLDGPDSGRIDLRTAHGKSVFRKQIESATHASNETSEKVRAAFADMLASGYRVGGSGRLFGFEVLSLAELDDWGDEDDDEGRAHRPGRRGARGARPRSSASWPGGCSTGETVQAMADDLNERGITTHPGRPVGTRATCRGRWATRSTAGGWPTRARSSPGWRSGADLGR